MKESFFNSVLISSHSDFFALLVRRAMTGSRAILTLAGGLFRDLSSVRLSLEMPLTLSVAAMSAGSACPRSLSTFIFLILICSDFTSSSFVVFCDISFFTSAYFCSCIIFFSLSSAALFFSFNVFSYTESCYIRVMTAASVSLSLSRPTFK